MRGGLSLESGGVRLPILFCLPQDWFCPQSHLPATSSWAPASQGRKLSNNRLETNLACKQAIQETSLYIYIPFCFFPPRGRRPLPDPLTMDLDWYCDHFRAWTQQGLLSLFVKMINLNLVSSRTRILGFRKPLLPLPAHLASGISKSTGRLARRRWQANFAILLTSQSSH